MFLLRPLLSRVLTILLPLAIAATVYLYLYPVFQGCAFPLPVNNDRLSDRSAQSFSPFLNTLLQRVAPHSAQHDPAVFRLLVLADPQLEGDSSLPDPDEELFSRINQHWTAIESAVEESGFLHRDVFSAITTALRTIVEEDLPRTLEAARKRLDLLGNDYYLAHIYRTLHWWSRPTHVTVLGDLIGSQWVTDEEFDRRGSRYWNRVFKGGEIVSDDIAVTGAAEYNPDQGEIELEELKATDSPWERRIINIVGNHDVGYSGDASEARIERFERMFGRANWDVRFRYPRLDNATITPTLHVINLNTLTLDGPPFSQEIQSGSYAFLNDLITHRSYPVEDRTTFTLLLTHLPLHKKEGVCTDGPYFTYHESDDEDSPDGIPRFKDGGLREQNHLGDYLSAHGVLQGIFGMSGNEDASGGGWGRNGLILTGHDHTGCDVVHFVNRSIEAHEEADESQSQTWNWDAKRYTASDELSHTPSIREVTLRSMMGEYGGNAGLLSLWFDADPAVNEWKYEITMCMAGVQHIWWAVHIVDIVALILVLVYVSLSSSSTGSKKQLVKSTYGKEKKRQ